MSFDAASALPLRIAIANYGHTAALKRGIVPIAGVQPEFVEIQPIISAFRRMVRDVEFDVCEMAPATYMIARAAGAPFKALPVFIFRRFHHAGLIVRKDAGIARPVDLEGKRVGVRGYSVTTGIWTRGILADEYGVRNDRINWVVDDEEHVASLRVPENVRKSPAGKSLVDLIADGYLSAAFTGNAGIGRAGAPNQNWQATGGGAAGCYDELFADAAEQEAAWYARTGIYPIHGLLVVKDSVLAENPHVARALFDACVAAKEWYLSRLASDTSSFDTDAHYRAMQRIVGADPLPYGVEANRPSIDALIRYCFEQRLLPRQFRAEDLFINPAT
ncbi:ABC transporter substrate-binding protein [Paraburkholderia tropica]|uniref:ABC transporter substrate-binding protein n=1 Tax=Paraburkholderia tropica TaxID=92647 RepID=UPI0007EDA653|nr:ABC transporter substrate-binding protein [Paraburkholderia tropica]OBR50041.1 4,5-dihydroxyphthalate decarboxylase [Paraburkholderia tropica]